MTKRKTLEEFIQQAKNIHGDKYDYSKVNYKNCDTNITIICKEHGEFEQTPKHHLMNRNCLRCARQYSPTNCEFIQQAINVHGDKYDYSKVEYKNAKTKITIICKKHGEFKQQAHSHLQGHNCPNCLLCPSCFIWRTLGKLCSYCKPKNENKLYQKTREYDVLMFLKKHLPDNDFIHNKSVGSHCTKGEKENSNGHLFPDIRFDCGFYNLIVEIDEHKHRGASYKCDEQRMYDIIAKLYLPCIFIRYNPDSVESNKTVLLEKVKEYLNIKINAKNKYLWNCFGFYAEYLFY